MFLAVALIQALAGAPAVVPAIAPADTTPIIGPIADPAGIRAPAFDADTTIPRRRKAVDVSDAYAMRLKIHYIASYATIPIFAAQAIVGEQLYNAENSVNSTRGSSNLRAAHTGIALALGGLFAVNTVTGAWNWWETRNNPQGRAWRTIHAALMVAADGGFAYTAALSQNARYTRGSDNGRTLHKNWAIGSASVALASYVMMWKPFRRD
jgi:hypothetical protein